MIVPLQHLPCASRYKCEIVANALFLNRPIVNFFANALNESGNLPSPSDHDFKAQVTIEVCI